MNNKRKRIGIWIVAALVISVVAGLLWNGSRNVTYAKEVFVDTETLVQDKVSTGTAFKVLEIVSAPENARLGYLIGGCEPNLYGSGMKDVLKAEGLLTDDVNSSVEYPITYLGVDVHEFDVAQPDLVAAGYTESVVTTTVSGSDASGNAISGNDIVTTVYRYEKDTFRNNEVFKKYVLGMSGDLARLNVQVVTKTPADLTAADIEGADLIYVSGKNADVYASGAATVVFTDDVAKTLTDRITQGDNRKPCIIDFDIFNVIDAASNGNLYRICLVLLSEYPENAYQSVASKWSEATDTDAWTPIVSTQVISNGGHFVRENIYWYSYKVGDYVSSKSPLGITKCFVNADVASYFSAAAIGDGFANVVAAIDAENYNNSINNPGREAMSTNNVTQAITVQYLLKYNVNKNIIYKNVINVLEIQPCKEFDFDDAAGKTALIEKWIPAFKDNQGAVTITCMTMAEFIGHNESVNETYDLIYIGSNTGMFYTTTLNATLEGGGVEQRTYRRAKDSAMNGLLYSHVGDLGQNAESHWGLIATDTSAANKTDYRFPGNDLTTYKLDELKSFLDSGSPIIVADDFFTYQDTNSVYASGTPTAINGGKVAYKNGNVNVYGILDTSSYVYQLVVYGVHGVDAAAGGDIYGSADWAINWNGRACRNFFYESGANADNLLSYINQQKLYLNLATRPVEYTYSTAGTYGYVDSASYLKPSTDGNYYLTYEFSISSLGVASGNQTYDCKLFIDINNDGKFSKTQEEMDSLVIREITTGAVVGRAAGGYQLRAGVAYRLTRALPDDYMGCIAWELLCTSNSNDDIHASATGYTVAKDTSVEKQVLKILQVTSGDSTGTAAYANMNSNNVNLQAELEDGMTVWGELLSNVPDFDLDITTISTYGENGLVKKFKENNAYLEQFDMLIFGFGDGYADIRYQALLEAIEAYGNSGKCILFTHDTTFVEFAQLEGYGYTAAGESVALDKEGKTTPAVTAWGQYNTSDIRSRFLTQTIRQLSGMDPYGVTENGVARSGAEVAVGSADWNTLMASGKDMAFKPNTYQTQTVANTQGASYIQLRETTVYSDQQLFCFDVYSKNVFRGLNTQEWGYGETNALVKKINDGMITNYPYKITDSFYVANTHAQYWALDLESDEDKDGESDIVVWYTIEDYTTAGDAYVDDLCSLSPGDVKTNYYIYNKGNITYSGVGHRPVANEQEVKLFINTMVASYVASVKKPSVAIVEDGTLQASEISNITVPYTDGVVLSEYSNNTVRVYFSVYDNNIVKGSKTITANFYLNGVEKKLSIFNTAGTLVYDGTSGATANVLNSGNSYYVEVPASELAGHGSMDFEVEIYSDWNKNGTQIQSEKVRDSVKITKVELFDLD